MKCYKKRSVNVSLPCIARQTQTDNFFLFTLTFVSFLINFRHIKSNLSGRFRFLMLEFIFNCCDNLLFILFNDLILFFSTCLCSAASLTITLMSENAVNYIWGYWKQREVLNQNNKTSDMETAVLLNLISFICVAQSFPTHRKRTSFTFISLWVAKKFQFV